MSLPALQALRAAYPHAHIAVLARPWVADVFARESFADEVILYKAPKGWRGVRSWLAVARDLRRRRFDTAVLLPNSFESAAIAWLARIPRRIGFNRDGRGWLLTDAVPTPPPGPHQRFYYLELLVRSGLIPAMPTSPAIRLGGASEAAAAGRARFAEQGWNSAVTGISPGAAFGTAKRWLPERFAEAAASLGYPVALFGSADERELCDSIAAAITARNLPVGNFAGQTTLREYIDLAAACRIYLTNDSGGMHIASALGVPTVAVFGPTDHVATGPTGPLSRIVRQPVECSPCQLRECPIDHRCMTRVEVARVLEAAREVTR